MYPPVEQQSRAPAVSYYKNTDRWHHVETINHYNNVEMWRHLANARYIFVCYVSNLIHLELVDDRLI